MFFFAEKIKTTAFIKMCFYPIDHNEILRNF